jgi:SNF2 family DNA or RNA helicase
MVEVVITTPEMIKAEDWKELSSIQWEILVVDEGHRLKNHRSGLAKTLRDDFMFKQSLLLTGTPVQNNMEEVSLFGSTRK